MPGSRKRPRSARADAEAVARRPRSARAVADIAPRRLFRRFTRLLSLLASLSVLGGIAFVILLLYLRSQSLPVTDLLLSTNIYDNQGAVIAQMRLGRNREYVSLKDIAPSLVKATLAVEDRRFYEHHGIDPKGLLRAVATDLRTMSMEQGASTITQQLARNLYLNHERTWGRKIREAMYTVQLEMQLSKDQILEQYLNQIYYGHSTYGIQAAAQLFFGKNAKELTLAESAMLAGIPKGPKYYSPYLNLTNAKDRQKLVLDAMVKYGDIRAEEADTAYAVKLDIVPYRDAGEQRIAPYFRDYVKSVATEKLGITDAQLEAGGYRIYTTLDLHAQKAAEQAVAKQMRADDDLQAALVAIDPRTGYVKAMIGGKNYARNQYNRVFADTRQPGSSFKPFLYIAALENGYTPVTRYKSEPTTFTYDNGKTYTPSNYGGKYANATIDMRRAIAESDNVFAVHTILDVGADKVIDTARKLGITSPLEPLPSLALGTFPVSPFEMASAYGTIANQGVRAEPTAILRIEDSRGRTVYQPKPASRAVADAAQMYVLTNLMEGVFEEGGTGYRVSDLMKRPVAGKSGTTDADAWMIGFTPELATAVWVGYDRGRGVTAVEAHKAAPIFAEFTEGALEQIPPKLFPMPGDVVNVYIDPASGKLAGEGCGPPRMEAFVKGTEPMETCTGAGGKPVEPDSAKRDRSWWNDLKRWWNG